MRNIFFALLAGTLFASCSKDSPTPVSVPSYQTMQHLTAHGAMFHFNHAGKYYIGCSIHQGGMSPGTQLKRKGQENAIVIKNRVHKQTDLHVWTYDEGTLSPDTALPYLKKSDIKKGDLIYILNNGNRLEATVTFLPQNGGHHYGYKTRKTFPAGGMSGSPIFSARTKTVIGVLQTANSKTHATQGGFEALQMP